MNNNLDGLPTEQLNELMQQCWERINAILDRMNDAPDMQARIRRMINSNDMAAEFNWITSESPELAKWILKESVAALVNLQSVQGIHAAIVRRASAGN